ncbi:MAG TPA: amidohydrolase [Bacillota bacterium]|nr:amidohydrolase [Bacillota bacterium]
MYAIVGGQVMTITNGTIENGVILVKDGKIEAIEAGLQIPDGYEIIDARGQVVMPGLIDAHSHISLFGEPGVPATADGNEMTNPITAQLRGIDALNPFDPAIPIVREAGFTSLYTGPGSANLVGGTGLGIKLRGRTAEEMAIPGTEAMKMALGENPKRVYSEQKKAPSTRMGVAAVLREALVQAQNYLKKIDLAVAEAGDGQPKLPDRDLKLEALGQVLKRELKARIHCHRADDMITAIRIAEEFNLDYSLEHATEGYKIADILAEKGVVCVVGPLLMGPSKHELWEVKLENPGILARAGVRVVLQADTSSGTRWLPMHAGLAIKHGMPEDEAFKSVTIYSAELIGISDRVGSLEVGKDADIAIFDGHPFCNMTSCVLTMIDGVIYHNDLCDDDCCCHSDCCN